MNSGSTTSSDKQPQAQKLCLACSLTFPFELTHCPKDGTQLIPFGQDENLGKVINDKFKINELIGKGGMGSVYLAEDLIRPGNFVAIKMLHAQLSEDQLSVKRFQQEASAAADLQHPNLIHQYDYGMIEEKTPFLVMEYLQGQSLSELIKEHGPVNPIRALNIFSQVMDGLKFAHDKGVVHRDIKPSNILLLRRKGSKEEQVKVLDFGLAKLMPWSGKESQHLTKTGEVFGSPIYMSPEQCMGKPLEPSSDIYSLGITIFETLTGKPPFKGQNVVQTASKHLSESPPPFDKVCPELNLSHNLQAVVFTALEKEPVHRFHDMNEFKNALVFAVTGQGQAVARVQAAMTPDATRPVKKVDLDTLRASTQIGSFYGQTCPEPETKKMPPLVIPVICGLLVLLLVGAGVFMLMPKGSGGNSADKTNRQPLVSVAHTCKGTVYYLSVKAHPSGGPKSRNYITEVHLQTPSGLVRLKGNLLPRNSLDLLVGKEWQVSYKGDDAYGELEKYTAAANDNADVSDANNIVENYFARLADRDSDDVFNNMLSDNFISKTYKGLSAAQALKKFTETQKGELFQDYRNDKVSFDSKIPPLTMPTGEKLPPAQATKVLSVGADEIRIIIDMSMFYTRAHGYECFTLKKENGSWKIDSIESVAQAVWDGR